MGVLAPRSPVAVVVALVPGVAVVAPAMASSSTSNGAGSSSDPAAPAAEASWQQRKKERNEALKKLREDEKAALKATDKKGQNDRCAKGRVWRAEAVQTASLSRERPANPVAVIITTAAAPCSGFS